VRRPAADTAPSGVVGGARAATTAAALVAYLLLLLLGLARLAAQPAEAPLHLLPLLGLSLAAALCATLLALAVGVPAALWLSRTHLPGRRLVTTLLDLPTMLSPVAVGTAIVLALRAPPGSWLEGGVGLLFAFPGVVAAQFTVVVALVVRASEAAFVGVDPRLERLAELHGASKRRILWRVTLPLARPGLLAAAVLAFARALGEFGATVTVAGTLPGRTETLATGLYIALESGHLAVAARLALLLVAVAAAVLLLLRWAAARTP